MLYLLAVLIPLIVLIASFFVEPDPRTEIPAAPAADDGSRPYGRLRS